MAIKIETTSHHASVVQILAEWNKAKQRLQLTDSPVIYETFIYYSNCKITFSFVDDADELKMSTAVSTTLPPLH